MILPFFVGFIIRTLAWKLILADNGFVLRHAQGPRHAGRRTSTSWPPRSRSISGLTYNFLPFMILPLYVALEKIDPQLIEAATDLYASRAQAFRRVTLPCRCPACSPARCSSFIPAVGDFINAEILGSRDTT